MLRDAIVSGGFVGRRCILSLPERDVFLQSMQLPPCPTRAGEAVAEVPQRMGVARDAIQSDWIRTGADDAVRCTLGSAGRCRETPCCRRNSRPDECWIAPDGRGHRVWRHQSTVQPAPPAGRGSGHQPGRAACGGACIDDARASRRFHRLLQTDRDRRTNVRRERRRATLSRAPGGRRAPACSCAARCRGHRPRDRSALREAIRPVTTELAHQVLLCLRCVGDVQGLMPQRSSRTGTHGHEPDCRRRCSRRVPVHVAIRQPVGLRLDWTSTLQRDTASARCGRSEPSWICGPGTDTTWQCRTPRKVVA